MQQPALAEPPGQFAATNLWEHMYLQHKALQMSWNSCAGGAAWATGSDKSMGTYCFYRIRRQDIILKEIGSQESKLYKWLPLPSNFDPFRQPILPIFPYIFPQKSLSTG